MSAIEIRGVSKRFGNTPVLQLFFNLRSPSGYTPFLLFMIPVGWTGVRSEEHTSELQSP